MEQEYLETIEKHKGGRQGKRGVDSLANAFAQLVDAMEKTRADILGDIFQGSITYGERGQFLTPEPIARMMAQTSLPSEPTDLEGRRSVCDPACGSGRTLLAVADIQPHWHFVGQDADLRCTRMCAINLALRNLYGHAVWGNSLRNEAKLIYETGRVQVWGNAIRKVSRVPLPDREPEEIDVPATASDSQGESTGDGSDSPDNRPAKRSQLRLF